MTWQRRDDGGRNNGAWPDDSRRMELPVEVVVVAWGLEGEYWRDNGVLVWANLIFSLGELLFSLGGLLFGSCGAQVVQLLYWTLAVCVKLVQAVLHGLQKEDPAFLGSWSTNGNRPPTWPLMFGAYCPMTRAKVLWIKLFVKFSS